MGSQIEILPEVGEIQKFIWNVAGGIFRRALELSGGPFAKKVTPGTTIPLAKRAM